MAKYKKHTVDNRIVKDFLINTFITDNELEFLELVPNKLRDILYGASRQSPTYKSTRYNLGYDTDEEKTVCGGTRPVSEYSIFRRLMSISEINTDTVDNMMNRKAKLLGYEPIKRSQIEYHTRILKCASEAIMHHYDLYPAKEKDPLEEYLKGLKK